MSPSRIGRLLQEHDSSVVKDMNGQIDKMMKAHPGKSRAEAAQLVMDSKEGWYWQTPEGEFLTDVIKGKQ